MAEASRATWHRAIWQRLPRRFRRATLFRVASIIAPRIDQDAPFAPPLIVVGSLKTASGLGQSARLCHDALRALGLPTYGIDIGPGLMQPDDGVHFEYADGSTLTGQGTLIFHVNGPLMALAVLALPRELISGKRIVGYWAWELPSLPSDWRAGFGYVHEIWVPSRFTAVAVEAQAGSIPVHVVPHPVALRYAAPDRKPRDARTPFTALAIFNMASSFARKNPIAAIEAFRMAFGSDPNVRLIVKCSNMAAYQKGTDELRRASISSGNITLLEEIMSAPELAELYAKAHVLLSLHRSEGFGLAIAEAMLAELPVIATNWSGNIDFLTKQIGVPVGYRLVPSRDPQATYDHAHMHWAEPDIWEAAEALRQLRADPVAAHRLGMEAAAHARAAFGPNCYAAVLSHLLPGAAEPAGN